MKGSDKGHPTYECRRCGGISYKVDVETTMEVLAMIILNPPTVIQVGDVHIRIVHGCPDGGVGISDIVGLTPSDVVEATTTPDITPNAPGGRSIN